MELQLNYPVPCSNSNGIHSLEDLTTTKAHYIISNIAGFSDISTALATSMTNVSCRFILHLYLLTNSELMWVNEQSNKSYLSFKTSTTKPLLCTVYANNMKPILPLQT
jgi:hypothetical protein